MKIIIDTTLMGHDDGQALIMAERCKQMVLPDVEGEVSLIFRNGGKFYKRGSIVQVFGIAVKPEQKGYGTIVMQKLCSIADEERINLILSPSYCSYRKRLIEFYGRFDFLLKSDGDMERAYKSHVRVVIEFFKKIMRGKNGEKTCFW